MRKSLLELKTHASHCHFEIFEEVFYIDNNDSDFRK